MSTLSTVSPSADASAGLLQRLRAAMQKHPTELKWLGGIGAFFLLVNGEVKSAGKVLSVDEIKMLLSA
jgi:hypothetical protein